MMIAYILIACNAEDDDYGLLFKVPPKDLEDTAMTEAPPSLSKASDGSKHTFGTLEQEMGYWGTEGWVLQRISLGQGSVASHTHLVSATRQEVLLMIEFEGDRVAACQVVRSPDELRKRLEQRFEQRTSRTLSDILHETLSIVQNEV
jgi:hypothetical protein